MYIHELSRLIQFKHKYHNMSTPNALPYKSLYEILLQGIVVNTILLEWGTSIVWVLCYIKCIIQHDLESFFFVRLKDKFHNIFIVKFFATNYFFTVVCGFNKQFYSLGRVKKSHNKLRYAFLYSVVGLYHAVTQENLATAKKRV